MVLLALDRASVQLGFKWKKKLFYKQNRLLNELEVMLETLSSHLKNSCRKFSKTKGEERYMQRIKICLHIYTASNRPIYGPNFNLINNYHKKFFFRASFRYYTLYLCYVDCRVTDCLFKKKIYSEVETFTEYGTVQHKCIVTVKGCVVRPK